MAEGPDLADSVRHDYSFEKEWDKIYPISGIWIDSLTKSTPFLTSGNGKKTNIVYWSIIIHLKEQN